MSPPPEHRSPIPASSSILGSLSAACLSPELSIVHQTGQGLRLRPSLASSRASVRQTARLWRVLKCQRWPRHLPLSSELSLGASRCRRDGIVSRKAKCNYLQADAVINERRSARQIARPANKDKRNDSAPTSGGCSTLFTPCAIGLIKLSLA